MNAKKEGYFIPLLVVALSCVLGMGGCVQRSSPPGTPLLSPSTTQSFKQPTFTLTSSAFDNGQSIPPEYTCKGENISPPLQWVNPPPKTKSLVIIVEDPDAPRGTFVHWMIYNIPATTLSLPEAIPLESELPDGSRQGTNDFGALGYAGPCPPGGIHHYSFRIYALDVALNLQEGVYEKQLLQAMEGHILTQAELMGGYPAPLCI